MSSFSQNRFIIIAGQPKAGTTSLYDWLTLHPQICPATLKETRFFLDEGYPLERPETFDGHDISRYAQLYPKHDGHVFLEATPDYLYSARFLQAADLLPNACVVVLLRDPVSRLLSAYHFYRQRGLLAADLSFDDWVAAQHANGIKEAPPVQHCALDHCHTEKYLPRLSKAFGSRLTKIDFEDLRADPRPVADRICELAGLVSLPENLGPEKISNRARAPKWPAVTRAHNRLHRKVSQRLLKRPALRAAMRPLARGIRAGLSSDARPDTVTISDESHALIKAMVTSSGSLVATKN